MSNYSLCLLLPFFETISGKQYLTLWFSTLVWRASINHSLPTWLSQQTMVCAKQEENHRDEREGRGKANPCFPSSHVWTSQNFATSSPVFPENKHSLPGALLLFWTTTPSIGSRQAGQLADIATAAAQKH